MASHITGRTQARFEAINRPERKIDLPKDQNGAPQKSHDYYGDNLFDLKTAPGIPEQVRKEILSVSKSRKFLSPEHAEVVAQAVTDWATSNGATYFSHWFQPLTGSTAEKHDSFLHIDKTGRPLGQISVAQLLQGEPDASSFPNGGSRSTFEARGYTSWDLTSPMFITEGVNGKTLCIPTAFVSYFGDALDIKTPLLRSVTRLGAEGERFLKVIGKDDAKSVNVTVGCEQEFFLIDKAFYYGRPDLVMSGRTLMGELSAKNQQLDDHYFGTIPDRVLSFLQEIDLELHRLGIPCKTRHNEVAPGQFEIAPIFTDANIAADQNQLTMAILKKVARKHNFVCLLHEKPFASINGSGKHLNWSMSDDTGRNFLSPGKEPHQNYRFLAFLSTVIEAVRRNSGVLRAAIAGHGNDHRLGANEAPPSVISVFLGDTLDKVCRSVIDGSEFTPETIKAIDLGAEQLAQLMKDNTDRNRTSPFAFTGNKFEFRALGSSAAVGLPLSILNAAVAEVLEETNNRLEELLGAGQSVNQALLNVAKKWLTDSYHVVFNGDGYSDEWLVEAEKRGLPNMPTTAESLRCLSDKKETAFLVKTGVFTEQELDTRFHVLRENYIQCRKIEFETQMSMVSQFVLPTATDYKLDLVKAIEGLKRLGMEAKMEEEVLKKLNLATSDLYNQVELLRQGTEAVNDEDESAEMTVAHDLMTISEKIARLSNEIEAVVPDTLWPMPKFIDMLFTN